MTYEFTIPGRLPGLNEMISAERTNRFKAAKLKSQSQNLIGFQLKQQLRGVQIHKPVVIHYIWYEMNRRRDVGNISGYGHKVINDALVQMGVIKDDSQKYVIGMTDTFSYDREHPRIVVMLEEKYD